MARVLTNNFGLRCAREATFGTKPTTGWMLLEPNTPGAYGPTYSPEERRPISPIRGRRKRMIVDADSVVEYEADTTMDALFRWWEALVFAEYANVEFDLKESSAPPSVDGTNDEFNIDAASATLAGKMQWAAGGPFTLVYAKGYTNAANNGLHALDADVASTDTVVGVSTDLTEEASPPANASLQVAGVRCAIGDLAFTISGSVATIVSAADIADWSTLGLFKGMYIHVGSDDGTGGRQNHFDDGSGGDVFGYARIYNISGATLYLDKLDEHLDTTDAANATLVDIMFGRFARNVLVDADATDNRYLEAGYSFEGTYPDLGGVGTPQYEYAPGSLLSEIAFNLPLAAKSTLSAKFVCKLAEAVTASRATGPSSAVSPLRTAGLPTASGIASISTDLISAVSDIGFKSLTVTAKNNVTGEKILGLLGPKWLNAGLFEVNFEGQLVFTSKEILDAIRNNTTVTFACILANEDGAVAIDVPACTLDGGGREFPLDASVLVNINAAAFNDPAGTIPDVSIGVTVFPSVPTDRT